MSKDRRGACTRDAIATVVDQIYAAAADDRLWVEAAAGARDLIGGICVTNAVIDRRSGTIPSQTILYDDAAGLERYMAEGIYRLDPQAGHSLAIDRSCTWTDREVLDEADPATAEFCRWIRSNSTLGHYVSVSAVAGDGAFVNALSVHKAQDDGALSGEDERIMAALLPHLHHASALALVHADKINAAYWDGLLAQRDEAAALIGRDGRVLRTTPCAEALLRRGEGLDIVGGRLRAARPEDDDRLSAAIRGLSGPTPRAAALRVRRGPGRSALTLAFYPLVRAAAAFARDDVVGLVTIVDPAAAPRRRSLFREAFALTARESEVADMLMAGHSIESAAAALEISRNTARIHLRQLFAKTETSRQSELVRLLGRL